MNGFVIELAGAAEQRRIEGAASFMGEDESGGFGIMAGHERFITVLSFGLARFRVNEQPWQYLATTGGALYFDGENLRIATRRFLVDSDPDAISRALEQQLAGEEQESAAIRESLRKIEQNLLRRLMWLGRGEVPQL